MDWAVVIAGVIGLLAGYGIKVVVDNRKTDQSSTRVDQSRSTVRGDQVGRDKITGTDREPRK